MSKEEAMVPRLERTVDFYGDQIPVAQGEGESLFVPIRPLSEFLGISATGQRERIRRDRVMNAKARQVVMTLPDGRHFELFCLPLEMIPGWLFGISTSRMRPELQKKLDLYRAECFNVLWNAFRADILPYTPASAATTGLTAAEQTLEMIRAMEHLAQQQVEMERRTKGIEDRQGVLEGYMRGFIQDTHKRLSEVEAHLQHAGRQLDNTDTRLSMIELRLDPAAQVTDAEAAEIALAVKTVGHALEAKGQNAGYARVYSEMYRRYRISSYKNLPNAKYDEVLQWLSRWYEEINKDKDEAGSGDLATVADGDDELLFDGIQLRRSDYKQLISRAVRLPQRLNRKG